METEQLLLLRLHRREFAPIVARDTREEELCQLEEGVDRVELFHGTWADAAVREVRAPATIASLLDSMDWMPPEMIAENISKVVANMDKEKAASSFLRHRVHSPVLAHLDGTLVPDYDRVGWYLTQFIAPTPEDYNPEMIVQQGMSYFKTRSSATSPSCAMASKLSKVDVRAYKHQGERYDGFREAPSGPGFHAPRDSVGEGADVGLSGLRHRRDIEFVVGHVQKCNTKVYLCDLSDALLKWRESASWNSVWRRKSCWWRVTSTAPPSSESSRKPAVTCSYCVTDPRLEEGDENYVGFGRSGAGGVD